MIITSIKTDYSISKPLLVFKQKDFEHKYKKISPVAVTETTALSAAALSGAVLVHKSIPDKYIKTLAKEISKELKKEIKTSDLASVMTLKEFNKFAKVLKNENYIASEENIKKGVFCADFHSHSNFSDGVESVQKILNQAAEYGDRLNKLNGKKFLFALSDHDGILGTKEALKIIAQNPEKYKNVKFIPAAELSTPIQCEIGSVKNQKNNNEVEMVEFLIYGINPFSQNTQKFFDNLYQMRKEGVQKSLKMISEKIPNVKFIEEEYNNFFLLNKTPYCMLNQHWKIFHYANLKTRITKIAESQGKDPEELYYEIMPKMLTKWGYNGSALDKYIQENNLPKITQTYAPEIINLKKELIPHFKGPILYAPYENSYETIIEYANKENAVLGFAHPVFTLQNMKKENVTDTIKKYIEKSDGKLIYSENYHQAYPSQRVTQNEINETNKIMEGAGMIPIGGRDAHVDNFKL